MSTVGKSGGTFGYLALVQLLASAATDDRVTGAQLRALNALARYAGPDGTCCVALFRLAAGLGVKRQPVQRAVKALTSYGYLTSKERWRKTGARGANVYTFNLALEGAVACPVVWSQGLHLPESAGRRTHQEVQGVHPLGSAHNKPIQQTCIEETSASPSSADHREQRSLGTGADLQAIRCQQRPNLPIVGSGRQSPQSAPLMRRIADHNRDAECIASGRLWSAWTKLDPELLLYDRLGAGAAKVAEKAQDIEASKPGQGVRYLAGAIERATGGAVTARAILRGEWSRRAADT